MNRRNFLRTASAALAAPILAKLPIELPSAPVPTDYLTDYFTAQGYEWSWLPTPESWLVGQAADWQAPKYLLVDCLGKRFNLCRMRLNSSLHRVKIVNFVGHYLDNCHLTCKQTRTAIALLSKEEEQESQLEHYPLLQLVSAFKDELGFSVNKINQISRNFIELNTESLVPTINSMQFVYPGFKENYFRFKHTHKAYSSFYSVETSEPELELPYLVDKSSILEKIKTYVPMVFGKKRMLSCSSSHIPLSMDTMRDFPPNFTADGREVAKIPSAVFCSNGETDVRPRSVPVES